MKAHCEHISANCNPMPNTLQFLDEHHIVFCFSNQVGLYSLPQNMILFNINSASIEAGRANCLKVVDRGSLLVGYDSGHLALYKECGEKQWRAVEILKQEGAITLIHIESNLMLTNNTQGQITIYELGGENLKSVETIKFPLNKIIESIASSKHEDQYLFFFGGVDQKVHLYTRKQNQQLKYRFGLSGHENAITKLTLAIDGGDYLLASASKDGYIRLWRLTGNLQLRKFHKNVKEMDKMICFLDAVLISHECSVTDLSWITIRGKLQLVSCSLDCTVCIWGREEEGSWSVDMRMGQFLGNKNAYFNIEESLDKQYLVAVNYIGSAIVWKYDKEQNKFSLCPSFNGHTMEVRGVQWNHTGDFLVSVSKDQTTRIISHNLADDHFHEISRAQIHGYDINAVETIKVKDQVVDLIACGADEKVVRIVEPPACFANYLNYSTKANLHLYFPNKEDEQKYLLKKQGIIEYEAYAEGGTQVLGLMTKMQRVEREKITSYYEDEEEEAPEEEEKLQGAKETKVDYTIPPHDDYLVKHTLWPEMNKLYGHPHEISCLAKCNDRKLLVSSCSGLNKVSCRMIVWSTEDWKHQKVIEHHSYTVFGMDFSQSGNLFASVSKDRKLAVFSSEFEVLFSYEAHSRAATCLSFSPCEKFIATGSRDKTVKIHSVEKKSPLTQIALKKQIYAIKFCNEGQLAVGCHDGSIIFLKFIGEKLEIVGEVESRFGHTKAVTSLSWNKSKGLLASAGEDHSVRIFRLKND